MPPLRMHSSTMITRCVFFTDVCEARRVSALLLAVGCGFDVAHRDGVLVKRLERDEVDHLRVVTSGDGLLHGLLHNIAAPAQRAVSMARARACTAPGYAPHARVRQDGDLVALANHLCPLQRLQVVVVCDALDVV